LHEAAPTDLHWRGRGHSVAHRRFATLCSPVVLVCAAIASPEPSVMTAAAVTNVVLVMQ
jgi:hypothetical protein